MSDFTNLDANQVLTQSFNEETNKIGVEATLVSEPGEPLEVVITDGFDIAVVTDDGAIKVDGSGVTQPVSVDTLPLPADAATETEQILTNASLSSIDGKTPSLVGGRVPVDGSGVTQPVSGTVTIQDGGNIITVDGTVTANAGSGTFVVGDGGGSLTVDDGGTSLTVDGTVAATQSGTWNITNVSGTVSLPSGASTAANQVTANASLDSIDDKTPALSSGRVPVETLPKTASASGSSSTSNTALVSVDTLGYASGFILIDATGTATSQSGTIVFEGSNDNTNWIPHAVTVDATAVSAASGIVSERSPLFIDDSPFGFPFVGPLTYRVTFTTRYFRIYLLAAGLGSPDPSISATLDMQSIALNPPVQNVRAQITDYTNATVAIGNAGTMAEALSVTFASDQTAIPVSASIDTTGLATEAKQDTQITNLAAIKTAVEIIDNAISGSEMQVDVVTLPNVTIGAALPAGNNNIGDVDIASIPNITIGAAIPAGNNNIGDVDIASIAAGDNNIGNVDIVTMPNVTIGSAIPAGNNNIGDVDVLSLPSIPAGTNNIGDVDVLTLPSIPAGNNNIGDVDVASIAAGTNRIGSVRLVDSSDADLTSAKGTQTSRAIGVQPLTDAGRTHLNYYCVAHASGATTVETAITLTRSSGTSATTTGTSFVVTNGKTFRITAITYATRGHNTATAQTTTFNLRINTGGAVTTSSTPIVLAMRSATPATSNSWDRTAVMLPDGGYEIVGNGTLQWGITAAATFTTNAPTWDVTIMGYEY